MLAFEDEPAINFVAQYHNVAFADRASDSIDVDLRQHAARRVLRRI